MRFTFTPSMKEHIQKKQIHGIIIEVAQCDGDIEVTELHPHFVTEKQAQGFVKRRRFHPFEAECCTVYLPEYRLEYDECV